MLYFLKIRLYLHTETDYLLVLIQLYLQNKKYFSLYHEKERPSAYARHKQGLFSYNYLILWCYLHRHEGCAWCYLTNANGL